MNYCPSIYQTKRRKTRTVTVGKVAIGGENPVRVQSMTTSDTRDVEKTVAQAVRLAEAGCEIVRVTVQGIREAEACGAIKEELLKRGLDTPLVADIHFFPPAALKAADFVDKVRINPGNYADKRATFKEVVYDDAAYAKELERIEEKFSPLVLKCKELGRAMRIGVNHGSLSDRIMNRYGDTPQGMVESAFEFARICRKYDYHNFLFSMKASNPLVMVRAYRLLVAEMEKLGWDYPLHLGVTEAGAGEDGRVKSAVGIGALLLDGLGDTVRVSLTEDPWYEIAPCRELVRLAKEYEGRGCPPFEERHRRWDAISRREAPAAETGWLHLDGTVLTADPASLGSGLLKADGVVTDDPETARRLLGEGVGVVTSLPLPGAVRLAPLEAALQERRLQKSVERFAVMQLPCALATVVEGGGPEKWEALKEAAPDFVLFKPPEEDRLHLTRRFIEWLREKGLKFPVILQLAYDCSEELLPIHAAAEAGALLADGLGDGLFLEGEYPSGVLRALSFNILQAARMRTTKTEFISCPSCGRTLFDLQEVTRRIRKRTEHLPGVKIAVMGCIVNGPGEMADADFGYVGSKPGKIDLYVGKERVERDIAFADAVEALVALLKKHGVWVEPACDAPTGSPAPASDG